MNGEAIKVQRPIIITIFCILGFIGAVITIPLVFSSLSKQIGAWYPPYLAASSIIGLTTMIGLWKMKKWAVYGYTCFVLLNQVIMLALGIWSISSLIFPAIFAVICLMNLSKMT